jgi:hypothetical protein
VAFSGSGLIRGLGVACFKGVSTSAHLKSGLIIGVTFGGSGLIRGVDCLEGGNLIVYIYLPQHI